MADFETLHVGLNVGYHDANNVSNFGGDPVTQLNFKTFYSIIYAVLRTWRSIAVTRSQFLQRLLRDHAQTAAVWKTVAGHNSISTALVISYMFSLLERFRKIGTKKKKKIKLTRDIDSLVATFKYLSAEGMFPLSIIV